MSLLLLFGGTPANVTATPDVASLTLEVLITLFA